MHRKGLVVGIIILMLSVNIGSTFAGDVDVKTMSPVVFEGTTFYVDDDFNESTPGWNVTHFATINKARDNAEDGDTIFVYSGTYGRFHVRKSIQIIGENKFTTILDGNWNYNTISIETDNFLIKGFTVIRGKYGISVQQQKDVIISDMIFTNNDLGVMHNWNKNVHFNNITFHDNNGKAFDIWDANNCTISHCTFENDGIYHGGFPPSGSNSLFIRNNVFTNGSTLSLGNLCLDSHGVTEIESNIFQNNNYAITTDTCKGVIINNNNFINNTQHILLRKYSPFFLLPIYINYKQQWSNNYWDDLGPRLRYKIVGEWQYSYFFESLHFHYREFDRNPAQEPYDIGV